MQHDPYSFVIYVYSLINIKQLMSHIVSENVHTCILLHIYMCVCLLLFFPILFFQEGNKKHMNLAATSITRTLRRSFILIMVIHFHCENELQGKRSSNLGVVYYSGNTNTAVEMAFDMFLHIINLKIDIIYEIKLMYVDDRCDN